MPEKTLLAFADHGTFGALLEDDYAAAETAVAAIAAAGVDVDALAESLQRHGARAFSADWAALVETIGAKAAGMECHGEPVSHLRAPSVAMALIGGDQLR